MALLSQRPNNEINFMEPIQERTNVQKMFTQIAPTYDKLNSWLSFSQDKRWRKIAVAQIAPKLNLRVLDLCAGTLDMTLELLHALSHAQVTCVDFSQKMLALGYEKVPHVFRSQVETRAEDAQQLSLKDHSVDTVVCAFGMRNIPNQARALSEISRVLDDEGQVIILEFFQPEGWRARTFAKTYGKFVIPMLGGIISKHPQAYRYLHESTAQFYSLAAYRALLAQHGFTVEHCQALSGGIAHIITARKAEA